MQLSRLLSRFHDYMNLAETIERERLQLERFMEFVLQPKNVVDISFSYNTNPYLAMNAERGHLHLCTDKEAAEKIYNFVLKCAKEQFESHKEQLRELDEIPQ